MKKLGLFTSIVIMLAAISFAQVPTSSHVVLVVEQNHGYSSVIGSSAMPYLNSLAAKYGLATEYYSNGHPSIGNYFELTTGKLLTSDETRTPSNFPVSADNIVRQLMVAGKTWKSYAEGLPYVGYTGGDTVSYAVRRNPFAYLTDVQNSSAQKMNLVPFSQFATDLANNQLPDFSYLVPNTNNDGLKGTLAQADSWLQKNIAPLLANADFQQDGLLIITFDESTSTDTTRGGGRVATLVIGPKAKVGHKSTTVYQHQSLLKTVLAALGATTFPGAAAIAPAMGDFFASTSSAMETQALAVAGVTVTSPASGATVSSPVRFVASASSGSSTYPIKAMRIYVDNVSVYNVAAAKLDTSIPVVAGSHNVSIVAWDSRGRSYNKSLTINVGSTTVGAVTISSPANGATVSSPVQVIASAKASSGRSITSMRVYVDNNSAYYVSGSSVNTSLALSSGSHNLVVQAWDNAGTVYKSARTITVSTTSAGTVSVTPTSLSFGSVNVGGSLSKTVVVKANTTSVTLKQASLSGSGYTVSGLALPTTLAAGQSLTFTVTFAPNASGTLNGTLSLVSTAANSSVAISLSGSGVGATTPHAAALSWSPSTSTNVTGYFVYRGTVSGGPYTKLNSTAVRTMSYSDSTVKAGSSYYYVVTSVNSTGAESKYSSPVGVSIPAQ